MSNKPENNNDQVKKKKEVEKTHTAHHTKDNHHGKSEKKNNEGSKGKINAISSSSSVSIYNTGPYNNQQVGSNPQNPGFPPYYYNPHINPNPKGHSSASPPPQFPPPQYLPPQYSTAPQNPQLIVIGGNGVNVPSLHQKTQSFLFKIVYI